MKSRKNEPLKQTSHPRYSVRSQENEPQEQTSHQRDGVRSQDNEPQEQTSQQRYSAKGDNDDKEERLFHSFVDMITWRIDHTYADCRWEEFDEALQAMSTREETALVKWSQRLALIVNEEFNEFMKRELSEEQLCDTQRGHNRAQTTTDNIAECKNASSKGGGKYCNADARCSRISSSNRSISSSKDARCNRISSSNRSIIISKECSADASKCSRRCSRSG